MRILFIKYFIHFIPILFNNMATMQGNVNHVHGQFLPKISKPPFRGAIVLKVRGPVEQLLFTQGGIFFHFSNLGANAFAVKIYKIFCSFFKSEGLELVRYITIGGRKS